MFKLKINLILAMVQEIIYSFFLIFESVIINL